MPTRYKIGAASGSRPFSSPPCRAGHPKTIFREVKVLMVLLFISLFPSSISGFQIFIFPQSGTS
jgi:hypothetical protein